jgi:hypothetical protein
MPITEVHGDRATLINIVAALSAIPEQERQRLSHASRLKLDSAESDLRRLLRALTTGD